MGELFGPANQIVPAVTARGLTAVVAWDYLMWWRRRLTRAAGRTVGVAPARGGLRRAPLGAVAAVDLAALGLGLYQPMLGISMAAFLPLDLPLSTLSTRRCPTGDRVSWDPTAQNHAHGWCAALSPSGAPVRSGLGDEH